MNVAETQAPAKGIFATNPIPLKPAEIRHSLLWSVSVCGEFVAKMILHSGT
jgi:hypothetical protein